VKRVEQVVVVGADAPAWMVAAAIERSLGSSGTRVRVIELPTLLQPADCYSALPALDGFHHRIGLEDRSILGACKALPIAGQRFSNWAGAAPPFLHGYDRPPTDAKLDFVHFWTKGRQEGLRSEFESFSLGAMAAKAGRVPVRKEGATLRATFGYNIDARAYAALLRHCTLRQGVETKVATVADVEIDGDRIVAVVLDDGERVEADLFIDASGPQAVLIGRMPGAEFESWREWLPCDRMLVASGRGLRPYPSFSQISAFGQGWIGLFPLQDRTAVVAVYDSRHISDQEMVERLPSVARLPIGGDATVSELHQGTRKRSWVGNCVAVGESAFSLEPLDAAQLHIAHNCISQLMALFPVETGSFPEAETYHDIIRYVATNLRDFQAAHYKLNHRLGEPLWDRCRDAAVPETLRRKLDVFAARGHVPLYDFETFQEHGWASLFIGHGLIPQTYDPRLDGVPEQEQIAQVHRRMEDIVGLVEAMPSVDDFIAKPEHQHYAEVTTLGQDYSPLMNIGGAR
jgi:tryptophan 7-halogenase